jgi:hypothetical protein
MSSCTPSERDLTPDEKQENEVRIKDESTSDSSSEHAEGIRIDQAGSGTRTINFKPDAADPNWGLTRAHLEKHLFGDGPMSLRTIDPGGNPDLWFKYIQELAGRPTTATLKGGIEDIIGTFPKREAMECLSLESELRPVRMVHLTW